MPQTPGPSLRTGRDLLRATEAFARDSRSRSWWNLVSALALATGVVLVAGLAPWWPVRLAAGVFAGLAMVRCFVLYHDFMHGATLKGSRAARPIFYAIGTLLLAPPRTWRYSHNYHHAHVGLLDGSHIGTFPIMSTEQWAAASPSQRFMYRVGRHPATILFAYLTVFVHSICLTSLIENPRRYWDSALALLIHVGLIVATWMIGGPDVVLFAIMIPTFVASMVGAYLFYAQHNYRDIRYPSGAKWTFSEAALDASSYMKGGPLMRFFTANIGFHHVHHLNAQIPHFRLPEAMAAIPELQNPGVTSLHPREVLRCLNLKLWDPERGRMISWREARVREHVGV